MTGGIRLRALVLTQRGAARTHLDPVSVHRLDEPAPRQRDDPLRRRILVPLSGPSLRELSDHDVRWGVRQPVNEDRLYALTEGERAEIPEGAFGLMGRPGAIHPDVPVAMRLRVGDCDSAMLPAPAANAMPSVTILKDLIDEMPPNARS